MKLQDNVVLSNYFPNKYKGKCDCCGAKVFPNEGLCFKDNDTNAWVVLCVGCKPVEVNGLYAARIAAEAAAAAKLKALEADRVAKVLEKQELIEKLGLVMDKPFDAKTVQGAWSDDTVYKLAYTGDGTDQEFQQALSAAPGSSYGQLRWSGGASVKSIDRVNKNVTVFESVRLCD